MCSSRCDAGKGVLNGLLYAVGGKDNKEMFKSVEVYRPHTGTWILISDMNVPQLFSDVVALNGLLYVVGGKTEDGKFLNSVEMYNPGTDTWSMLTASMNITISRIGAFIANISLISKFQQMYEQYCLFKPTESN